MNSLYSFVGFWFLVYVIGSIGFTYAEKFRRFAIKKGWITPSFSENHLLTANKKQVNFKHLEFNILDFDPYYYKRDKPNILYLTSSECTKRANHIIKEKLKELNEKR